MRHVIIGAGPAGVVAAETLRGLDSQSAITLIGNEPEPPYSRMAIPYCLNDMIGEAGTYLRKTEGHYDSLNIEVVQDRVTALSTQDKTLTLVSGGSQTYDHLLIASGSTPTAPPIDGIDLPGVHACWTLDDYRRIIERAKPGSSIVLMGAGFIGCIILEALAARGVNLTVVELENRMVPRMMNEASGGLIKRWCEDKGVRVLTSTRVEGIESDSPNDMLKVSLSDGETLDADLVISATGVAPNTAFLEGSGIEVDHGILVNDRLQTNLDAVYAAGDVAQGRNFSTGEYSVQAIQPTAVEHARIAAINMSDGHELKHQGSLNLNVLSTMGLISASFGAWEGVDGGDSAELSDPGRYRYLNLQFKEDVLIGAHSLGLTAQVGILRGMIQTGLHLGVWKDRLMRNPLNLTEAYVAATQGVGLAAKAIG
jgi:NAD(P)H-nitrite reductase large subunit|tara:strand:- start:488 stop:1762 length:1275 start_codon:yes stop_codon:yes gene_type:complete